MGDVLRQCVVDHDGKWPKQLVSSGVMFYQGERITLEAFRDQAVRLGFKFGIKEI